MTRNPVRNATGLARLFPTSRMGNSLFRSNSNNLNPNLDHAAIDEIQQLRRPAGDVDDPPVDEGSAVIDAQADRPAVCPIGDTDLRSEREGSVRPREGVAIIGFPVGRQVAVQAVVIVRGKSLLDVFRNLRAFYNLFPGASGYQADRDRDAEPFHSHLCAIPAKESVRSTSLEHGLEVV